MTNREVLEIAMKQSAVESGCDFIDFLNNKNKFVSAFCGCFNKAIIENRDKQKEFNNEKAIRLVLVFNR